MINFFKEEKISSLGGIEPPTSRLTVERANRLRHEDLMRKESFNKYINCIIKQKRKKRM